MSSSAGQKRKSSVPGRPLLASIRDLPGVGPGRQKLLETLGIKTVADLLLYPPRRYIDRTDILPISSLSGGEVQTIVGRVESVEVKRTGRKSLAVARVRDGSGSVKCVWFNQPYLKNSLKRGETYMMSGPVRNDRFGTALVHPEYEATGGRQLHTGRIVAVYGLTRGFGQRQMRRLVDEALAFAAGRVCDAVLPQVSPALGLLPLYEALEGLHRPDDPGHARAARRRLAFDEMLLFQTLFARSRAAAGGAGGTGQGRSLPVDELVAALPFELTPSQRTVLDEVVSDLMGARPMRRLIQGDVGCGKTVIAALGACLVCAGRRQVALMCPTEVLAEQHHATMKKFLAPWGYDVALLTAGLAPQERQQTLEAARSGRAHMLVGTHSLFSERVEFAQLGLVIVDEEQRFGVVQRSRLLAKAPEADFLAVSATPIPRTLALTAYGDLDISVIDEMPPGRGGHITRLVPENEGLKTLREVAERLRGGEQAFYICPVVEEGSLGLKGIETARRGMDKLLGRQGRVAAITGRTAREERQAAVAAFEAGRLACIVATSVLEVGIDVPGATLLVVEQADRFGLSQLHQMRGRVRRSARVSRSYFIVPESAGERAMSRLKVLEQTYDGFDIAEQDLLLRGPGDLIGRRQHGVPDLRFTSLPGDIDLLRAAREEAFALVRGGSDPEVEAWLDLLGHSAGQDRPFKDAADGLA
jgi:ATP-dependent DNA helicase RecG